MSSNSGRERSVRFAEGSSDGDNDYRLKKRQRMESDEGNTRKEKSWTKERPNEDEMDDVDDWQAEEDEDLQSLPTEKERLEAKRVRREQRQGGKESTATRINDTTSLATEGVEIEPFHMDNERSDGTGYFDGDTYVFRKRGDDEEPDAWVESLKESGSDKQSYFQEEKSYRFSENTEEGDNDSISKEEWYAKIIPLVSDTETIMQAVVRYGALLKRQPLKRNKKRKAQREETAADQDTQSESFLFAQDSLNDLTEAANALLGGDVDIYQKTRNDLLKLVQSAKPEESKEDNDKTVAAGTAESQSQLSWEYMGSQDHQIHGPYTPEQMKAWIGAGYFAGAQAVQVRSVKEKEKSKVQDLLSDLMDDDDDEDQGGDSGEQFDRGEWVSSDGVNFDVAS